MAPDFAGGNCLVQSSGTGVRKFLAILIFVCMIFPAAFATGAGKSNVPCHGTIISPTIQITNSTFNGNERYGYLHEASCQILFSNNTAHHNRKPLKNPGITSGGVNVSDSNYGTFSSNPLYDNYAGFAFHLTFQKRHHKMDINQCLGGKSDDDTSNSLKHNHVVSNTIYTCEGDVSIGKLYGKGGTLNSRGNRFQSNHYHLADSTSDWFADADSDGKVELWTGTHGSGVTMTSREH
jgi:hypothetical protein